MKVEISEKSLSFLKELIKEIDSQDNRATAKPYYYVVQSRKERVVAPGCGDDIVYIHDGEGFSKEELIENFDLGTDEKFEKFIDDNYIEEVEVTKEHEDDPMSNVFFTEKACHRHIELNDYHYHDGRSYVKHAWRNPEMEQLFEAIRELTK